jgi:hypothetical protein
MDCLYGHCDGSHPPCDNCAFYFVKEGDPLPNADVKARQAVEGLDVELAEYFESIRYEDHPG